jgi:hypothetical protein
MISYDLDFAYLPQCGLQTVVDLALDLILEILGENTLIPKVEDDLHLIRLGTRLTAKAQRAQTGKHLAAIE